MQLNQVSITFGTAYIDEAHKGRLVKRLVCFAGGVTQSAG